MYKACVLILLAAPLALYSQSPDSSSAAPSGGTDTAAISTGLNQQQPAAGGFFRRGMFSARKSDAPVGSFTASYVYQYAPGEDGANRSLMGWSAVPEVNFGKYVGLQADFLSLYMRSVYPGQSRFMAAAGPRINFAPRSKFTPFIFMEGGEIRSTQKLSDVADWNPVATGGIGMDFKTHHGIGLQLIPGEYLGQYQDNGTWTHSFVSRVGVTFNFYK